MRRKSVLGLAVLTFGATCAVAAMATPAFAADCPDEHFRNADGRTGKFFTRDYVNIRNGPSLSCDELGNGMAYHQVQFHCTKDGWTHLDDISIGVSGWVKNDFLVYGGASDPCFYGYVP